jgi:hypothetical protein
MVYAPGRDADPGANGTVEYNPSVGAGGIFAQFLQGFTPKYAQNVGPRRDYFRNTLAKMFVRVDGREMNLFRASIADEHTDSQLVSSITGNTSTRQRNRTTGGAGATDANRQADASTMVGGYLDFFIQQASMPLQEKVDVKETLADNYVAFFFGQQPPIWSFTGWLFNTVQDDQTTNFLRLYTEILRGTQLARRQKIVSLLIDSYIITGAIVGTNFTLQANAEIYVPFAFQLLVKRISIVNYTQGWVPTRSDTPFAADPNASPYDARRDSEGDQPRQAARLPANGTQQGPVRERTADARTEQPPPTPDALAETATPENREATPTLASTTGNPEQQPAPVPASTPQTEPSRRNARYTNRVTRGRAAAPHTEPAIVADRGDGSLITASGAVIPAASGVSSASRRSSQANVSQASVYSSQPETVSRSVPVSSTPQNRSYGGYSSAPVSSSSSSSSSGPAFGPPVR